MSSVAAQIAVFSKAGITEGKMRLFILVGVTIYVAGVAIYTFNFGRWAWKYSRGGAIGLFLLALVTAVFPLYLLYFR